MCGRYASARKAEDIAESFGIRPERIEAAIDADYNVAPTKPVFTVFERVPRDDDKARERAGDGGAVRQLRVARWGLVPSWAKDVSIGNRLINARIESAADKPAFRRAFSLRRCLLPADGYYEWWNATGPDRRQVKQPYFIRPRDGAILAMAGLYEFWRDPKAAPDDPDAWVLSVTVLTTTAEDELGQIHDRMPLMVDRAGWDTWLDPDRQAPDDVRDVLIPAAPGRLEAYPVSREVNDVRHEGAHLLDPLPAEDLPDDLPALF
jgi:putative SOS response-associated peptidase YedK